MKEQTFITKLIDKDNRTIDFERWNYKDPKKCIKSAIQLYKAILPICKDSLDKANLFIIQDNNNAILQTITIQELKEKINHE